MVWRRALLIQSMRVEVLVQRAVVDNRRDLAARTADQFQTSATPGKRPMESLLVDDLDDLIMVVATLDAAEIAAHLDTIRTIFNAEGNPTSDLGDLVDALNVAVDELLPPALASHVRGALSEAQDKVTNSGG